jgi:hypothetical protein
MSTLRLRDTKFRVLETSLFRACEKLATWLYMYVVWRCLRTEVNAMLPSLWPAVTCLCPLLITTERCLAWHLHLFFLLLKYRSPFCVLCYLLNDPTFTGLSLTTDCFSCFQTSRFASPSKVAWCWSQPLPSVDHDRALRCSAWMYEWICLLLSTEDHFTFAASYYWTQHYPLLIMTERNTSRGCYTWILLLANINDLLPL